MRAVAGLCALVAACGFEHGVPSSGHDDGGNNGHLGDAVIDSPPDAFDPTCFGKAPFSLCLTTMPTQPLTISVNFTTDGIAPSCDNGRGVVMTVGGAESCVVAATDITFPSSITGSSGARPLVLVATGTITLPAGGMLDARSATIGDGPNANPSDCGTAPNGGTSGGVGGGGAGGSFGSKGGNGAAGGNATGGTAQAAVATPVNKLRGGCPGGNGGGGTAIAAGGSGGGAVAMLAQTKIQIDGTLTVSGAGGSGGSLGKGGGGGGGSGGMIVLHAPMLAIGGTARIMANGGGGGGGAGQNTAGGDGADATALDSAAAGGPAMTGGTTAGGAGAFKSNAAGSPAASGNGGPAGGGGVGVIRVTSGQSVDNATFSPNATN